MGEFSLQCTQPASLPTDSIEKSRHSCNHLQMTVFAQAMQPPFVTSSNFSILFESRKSRFETSQIVLPPTFPLFKALLGLNSKPPRTPGCLLLSSQSPLLLELRWVIRANTSHPGPPSLCSTALNPQESTAMTRWYVHAVCCVSPQGCLVTPQLHLAWLLFSVSSSFEHYGFADWLPAFNNVCSLYLDRFYIAVSFKSSFGNPRLDLANLC